MHTGSTKKFITILVLFLLWQAFLTAATIEEVYQQLLTKYETIGNYTADFTQINYWKTQGRSMESKGSIYIAGARMAILFRQPPGQKMIIDESLYLIDEIERTLIITSIEHTGGLFKPNDIINLYWNQSARELVEVDENTYRLILTPENDPYTALAEVLIRRSDFLITGVSYQDHQENRVDFSFYNEQTTGSIDLRIFEIPQGNEFTVIDNRNVPSRDY